MARRRFFVDGIHHGQAEVTGDEAHHLTRVLRVEPGQRYEISDGAGGVYLATVAEARKSRVLFTVEERVPLKPLPVRITLAFALIKFDRLEWILEKGTEAGVETFLPVIAERSEKGLEQAAPKRRERWERIVIEAAQQSRRDRLPELLDPVRLRDLRCEDPIHMLLDEDPAAPPILRALPAEREPGAEVALLLGPEGGWTDAERAGLVNAGWHAASLGPLVLRAETAAVAGACVVMNAWLR
ncbi:MAG: 16S rRNA (uracil(1498)-N(3))-methyltransferase [Bryobacterales bacterium]|nr:16S rRNA (uracil(1498)-N(3))-methyltransferase [Bryobacterales bacterium]